MDIHLAGCWNGWRHVWYGIPVVDAGGQKVYIGSDGSSSGSTLGVFYCLNTANGSAPAGWANYAVPTGTDRRIRSGAALDPNQNTPNGQVYFHCNNGYLYALDAVSGSFRWAAATTNQGAPTDPTLHPQAVSSSPVVGLDGTVYVGSSDGSVYAFNPSNGAQKWRVTLNQPGQPNEPMEATLAIDNNGMLYAATRWVATGGGNLYAISPAIAQSDPTAAKIWSRVPPVNTIGFIASPVVDQSGFIYTSSFDVHIVERLNPSDGTVTKYWGLGGKLCQTPSINQNGVLIIGVSQFMVGEVSEIAALNTGDSGSGSLNPLWVITAGGGNNLGSSFGSPVIGCDTSGTTYFADSLGKVYKFTTGAPLMAGQWPTFQCGDRRAGKALTYPLIIAGLNPFYPSSLGSRGTDVIALDPFGRSVGQSYGYYDFLNNGDQTLQYAPALWHNFNIIQTPGAPTPLGGHFPNGYAAGINSAGDVTGYLGGGGVIAWANGAGAASHYLFLVPCTSGYTGGYGMDINDSGAIIGYAWNGTFTHVFAWTKSGSTWPTCADRGAPSGGQAYAYAVTADGRIAGKALFSGSQFHAFRTTLAGLPIVDDTADLGVLGGTTSSSEAWKIHELQGTVGRSQNASGYWRAFFAPINCASLVPSYELAALPGVTITTYSSAAYGINRYGHVVGYQSNNSGANRAFRYRPGLDGMIDLNTLLPPNSGWVLTSAHAINDGGIIVGFGVYNSRNTPFILYPQCQE